MRYTLLVVILYAVGGRYACFQTGTNRSTCPVWIFPADFLNIFRGWHCMSMLPDHCSMGGQAHSWTGLKIEVANPFLQIITFFRRIMIYLWHTMRKFSLIHLWWSLLRSPSRANGLWKPWHDTRQRSTGKIVNVRSWLSEPRLRHERKRYCLFPGTTIGPWYHCPLCRNCAHLMGWMLVVVKMTDFGWSVHATPTKTDSQLITPIRIVRWPVSAMAAASHHLRNVEPNTYA